jgi:hypothetical protein
MKKKLFKLNQHSCHPSSLLLNAESDFDWLGSRSVPVSSLPVFFGQS